MLVNVVYLVSEGCIYEGGGVKGVFATRAAARASIFEQFKADKERRVNRWTQMTDEERQSFIDHMGYPLDRDEPWEEEDPDFFKKGHDFISIDEFEVKGEGF